MNEKPMGTPNGAQPQDEKIRWVTPKEAEKFVSMVGRQYVRKFQKEEKIPADQNPKDYFYKIIHVNPYTRMDQKDEGPLNFLMQFQVQKYYRNKLRKVKTDPNSEATSDVNVEVKGHMTAPMGEIVLVDPDACRGVDAFQFEQEFVPDTI